MITRLELRDRMLRGEDVIADDFRGYSKPELRQMLASNVNMKNVWRKMAEENAQEHEHVTSVRFGPPLGPPASDNVAWHEVPPPEPPESADNDAATIYAREARVAFDFWERVRSAIAALEAVADAIQRGMTEARS